MLIILIILIIILIYFLIKNRYETYYDVLPYKYDWDIYKCLDMDCVKQKSLDCFNACETLEQNKLTTRDGTIEQCQMACMNHGDLQADVLKWDNYTWNSLLPKFSKVSLLNKNADWAD